MFSTTPQAPTTTVNAITQPETDPDAERQARHIANCQELTDTAMKLARNAAERSQQAHDAYQPTPTPEPQAAAIPKQPDQDLTFTRLARCAQQAMVLEAQFAANAFARPAAAARATYGYTEHDPAENDRIISVLQHTILAEGIFYLTHAHPNHNHIANTVNDAIDDTLTNHSDDTLPIHFDRLCKLYDLTPNFAKLPVHVAGQLRPPNTPDRWP